LWKSAGWVDRHGRALPSLPRRLGKIPCIPGYQTGRAVIRRLVLKGYLLKF
jgi:hypothetical protein